MQPIPSPIEEGKQILCPNCTRRWPRKALARYALHWRVMHSGKVR